MITQASLTFIHLLSPPPIINVENILGFFSASQNSYNTKITLKGERGKRRREIAEILQFNLFSMVSQGPLSMIVAVRTQRYRGTSTARLEHKVSIYDVEILDREPN